ncbi:MAG: nucleotidyl transferase AbiEii/AbiGii toxin family protein [Fibrobacter sp.]|nr:nucleotidyl transferase AbiEii/AbiGii toxin family protein [Fibrobacter sp.]
MRAEDDESCKNVVTLGVKTKKDLRTKMTDELIVIKDVAKKLDLLGIPYMITGSIAMSLYIVPRMTRDIDLVVEISTQEIKSLIDLFTKDYYISSDSVLDAVTNKRMFNVIHNETLVKVDFIIKKEHAFREVEFERKRKVTIDSTDVWVVSIEDLILSKLMWAKDTRSSMQLQDIGLLLESDCDKNYIKNWAVKLGIDKFLEEARKR